VNVVASPSFVTNTEYASIFGVLPVFCIFRCFQRKNTADCSEMPVSWKVAISFRLLLGFADGVGRLGPDRCRETLFPPPISN
jgi:hypothetical protein